MIHLEVFAPGPGPEESPSERQDCPAVIGGFFCTLDGGHPGPHEAGDEDHRVVARWQS